MATDIWLGPVDPKSQPHNPAAESFMDLFQPGAQWQKTAAQRKVLKTSTQFLRMASDDQISTVINYLKPRNIALAMETFMLTASPRCGDFGVESYASPHTIDEIVKTMTRLGGVISYAAMDEPIHFGHYATGPRTCQDPIVDLAAQMVDNVHALKQAFPAIQFGDIEPLNIHTEGRINDILTFAKAFHDKTGQPISFVHADVFWHEAWRAQMADWRQKLHAAGIRFGVIIDGDAVDKTDAAWTAHALERYRIVMNSPDLRPDEVIFQTWMEHPSRMGPENATDTLTNGLMQALAPAPRR
jgi:hypothetical protein